MPRFLVDMLNKTADAFFGNYIQANSGFIQEEQLWIMQQGSTNISPHALPKGQGSDRCIHEIVKFKQLPELSQVSRKFFRGNLIDMLQQIQRFNQWQIPPE